MLKVYSPCLCEIIIFRCLLLVVRFEVHMLCMSNANGKCYNFAASFYIFGNHNLNWMWHILQIILEGSFKTVNLDNWHAWVGCNMYSFDYPTCPNCILHLWRISYLCCGQISIGTMLHLLLDLTRTQIDIIFTSSLSVQGMGLKMN